MPKWLKILIHITLLFTTCGIGNIIFYLVDKNEKNIEYEQNDDIPNNYYHNYHNKVSRNYIQKEFLSNNEKNFYNKLQELNTDYLVIPQISLASVIDKKSTERFHNELFRIIDFGIFDKNSLKLLLLIELNDSSHTLPARKRRDIRVKQICNEANIKLITFYTNMPNEKEYIINRIKTEIKKSDLENNQIIS